MGGTRTSLDAPLRRLRLGMVGGAQGGNIGRSHRAAALLDGRWEVVAGALSRDPAVAAASAVRWLIEPDRSYPDYRTMAEREAGREDRIDAVTVCTHNDTHHPIARTFLDYGFHVICDKPLTTSLENARDLVRAARAADRHLFVTYTYSGYPMVRLARDMIRAGELGEIRSVAVEYASQYQTELGDPADWQNDPALSGPLGVVAGTGTHAFHIAEFVTGLRVEQLSADLASLVPGHRLDDHATMHLRFGNRARGYLWNTTIAPGNENGLSFRVHGSSGGLVWHQEHPNHLRYTPTNAQPQILTRGGFKTSAAADSVTRVPSGHPEGYLEAFANLYTEVADLLQPADDQARAECLCPTVVDGARGVAFMFAALESSRAESRFVRLAPVEQV